MKYVNIGDLLVLREDWQGFYSFLRRLGSSLISPIMCCGFEFGSRLILVCIRLGRSSWIEARANNKKLNQELLKTQAQLDVAQKRIKQAQQELAKTVPPPDDELAAFTTDAKVMLVDNKNKVVHINIGANDKVYRGLTFSIYDKNAPIPKDGKGKAEIEVFNVTQNLSTARIVRSEIKNPIAVDDIAANLIWDSDRINIFVVAGEFDLDSDERIDYEGVEKINALIEKWGARAATEITVDTDYLVLGKPPRILRKPTFEQVEVDPMAMEKYEDSKRSLENYKQIKEHAQSLSIPIFNTERFLYFIGYKTQSTRPGAF